MSEVIVVARSRARPGSEEALEKALRACVEETHREKGCVRYALHRGADDASIFSIIERWTSRAELDAHLKTAHVATLFAKVPSLVSEEPEIVVLNGLGAGDPVKGRL